MGQGGRLDRRDDDRRASALTVTSRLRTVGFAKGQTDRQTPRGAGWTATTPTDPFGFNARWGYYFDRAIGEYYCENREYDPGTARWLERDPIGFAGGMNPYAYCAAQPVGLIDPDGEQTVTLRIHKGRLTWADKGCGHAWTIIDFGDGVKHSLELQPHGHLFGGGPMNDVDWDKHDTVHRPYDWQRTWSFNRKKYPTKESITAGITNNDWSFLNNCVDYCYNVVDELTGENYNMPFMVTPGDVPWLTRPINDVNSKKKHRKRH